MQTIDALPALLLNEERRIDALHDAMANEVQQILLASSPYERFILEQDGQLSELFLSEFLSLSMQQPPRIIQASTAQAALDRLASSDHFDLVVLGTQVGEMSAWELAARIKERWPRLPVILLGYDARSISEVADRQLALPQRQRPIDALFLWQGDVRLFTAIVKLVEDRLNLRHDVGRGGVQLILLIEDSVRFYSAFVPILYTELARHSGEILAEGANLTQKLLRLRARPKVVHCTDYESAWKIFTRYQDSILGVVSDVEFPWNGSLSRDAGLVFAQNACAERPHLPLLLQSSVPENEQRARDIGASFLRKGSPTLLQDLRSFLVVDLGFGDFVFRTPEGAELARATDVEMLIKRVRTVSAESLMWHGVRNHFSNWLMARTEFELANALRDIDARSFSEPEDMRLFMLEEFRRHRSRQHQGHVADFNLNNFDPVHGFVRIGGGSLGGKARGLAFMRYLLMNAPLHEKFPGVNIRVPAAAVIATDVFDTFLRENWLLEEALSSVDDEDLVERFVDAPFPEEARAKIKELLRVLKGPVAVRSSSLLEDLQYQPFAGIYETYMLPNDDPVLENRVDALCDGVKRVYASTFSLAAQAYLRATPYRLEEEKMAVIVMKVVGTAHRGRFYPDLSGVVRCHNFYPTPPMKAEDGIAAVVLGLGRGVAGGGGVVRFSPRHPRHAVSYADPKEWLKSSQREFWAIPLKTNFNSDDDEAPLDDEDLFNEEALREHAYPIDEAESDGTLAMVGSTYSLANNAVYDGIRRPGKRLVTFAPILKHNRFPLGQLLDEVSALGHAGLNAPVEMEFAVTLGSRDKPADFGLLQCRPLALSMESEALDLGPVADADVLIRSADVLGNGATELHDIVVVDYEHFDRARSTQVADEVGYFDNLLQSEGRRYLLIGVGRWGSRDRWLGIPVAWHQIAGVGTIVEAGFKDFRVEPSQGSHFFQNLTAFGIGYFTVNPELGEGTVDWGWLAAQPAHAEREMVRHLRFEQPLTIKMDGRKGEGVVLKPGVG